jgi:hypothetical protein
VHLHQVTLLSRRQRGLFATQMTIRLGHLHLSHVHTFDSEFVDDVFRIAEGTGQSAESGNDERVAVSARGEDFA